jgi:internalin A
MIPKELAAYDRALKRIELCRSKRNWGLDLVSFGLTCLPPQIGQLRHLRRLYLHNNQLSTLPPEISQLANLTELTLSKNQFSTVPPEIGQLGHLHRLYLHNNQLSTLPPAIGQLANLTELTLSNNQFSTVPPEIFRLAHLTRLDLHNNQLSTLPPEIGQLANLTALNLSRNRLSPLPSEIGRLRKLRTLTLEHNALHELPESMKELALLHELTVHGNEALGLPTELLGPTYQKSSNKNPPAKPQEILDYYFRLQRGIHPLNEFKLILVGHGAVGKTALVNRLLRGVFIPTDMTRGIHIEPWEVQAGDNRVAAHVWDFGGQDIMHGTHQFFLTRRSLYVLVLAARESKQNDDAEYWLKTISGFGAESPVIVALNKSEERPCDVNENALRKKYPAIQEFIKTDCKTGLGIEVLKAAISRAADNLEVLRDSFPAPWFVIKERLSGMKENFLTFEEFRRECVELGEPLAKEQELLASVLHILGIALNFRDDERLRDTSVLNPLWVTGGLYALLNDNELACRHGELRMADFARVLSSKDYPAHTHEFLRELMGKFELCFPLDGPGQRYLIPELLSPQEPDAAGPLDTNDALAFTYFYPRMLPHGLVPRFIVRLYQVIKDRLRWRTGVVLEWFDATALVKADEDDRCVRIRVHGSGRRRRELLGIIRQEFDELHRQFHGLLPREVIQLPD